jgi:hypothetical protein
MLSKIALSMIAGVLVLAMMTRILCAETSAARRAV